ncbi:MAG: hypothetical protein GX444_02670 [Myxococcales bacterium]|nr:hypothetical protein [Myxococcales bacterium]
MSRSFPAAMIAPVSLAWTFTVFPFNGRHKIDYLPEFTHLSRFPDPARQTAERMTARVKVAIGLCRTGRKNNYHGDSGQAGLSQRMGIRAERERMSGLTNGFTHENGKIKKSGLWPKQSRQ